MAQNRHFISSSYQLFRQKPHSVPEIRFGTPEKQGGVKEKEAREGLPLERCLLGKCDGRFSTKAESPRHRNGKVNSRSTIGDYKHTRLGIKRFIRNLQRNLVLFDIIRSAVIKVIDKAGFVIWHIIYSNG